jgi:hypothetical protein
MMIQKALKFVLIGILLIITSACASVGATEIWYEDNNLGRAGRIPADFIDKFNHPESFAKATHFINVYMLRANVLEHLGDPFLSTRFIPFLKKNGIKLAIDAGGATWTQVKNRTAISNNEVNQLKRLKQLGAEVSYISLQSALGKMPKGKDADYPMNKRLEDVVAYSKIVHEIYPQAMIGIIDGLLANGNEYKEPYRLAKDALAKAGIQLAYIHLDIPFDFPKTQKRNITWEKVRDVEVYVEDVLGIKFGILAFSRIGGELSDKEFRDRAIASMQCYAGIGGTPSAYLIMSWFTHPTQTIPENASGDDYPAMRTVLDFGYELEKINKGLLLSKPLWSSVCTSQ